MEILPMYLTLKCVKCPCCDAPLRQVSPTSTSRPSLWELMEEPALGTGTGLQGPSQSYDFIALHRRLPQINHINCIFPAQGKQWLYVCDPKPTIPQVTAERFDLLPLVPCRNFLEMFSWLWRKCAASISLLHLASSMHWARELDPS